MSRTFLIGIFPEPPAKSDGTDLFSTDTEDAILVNHEGNRKFWGDRLSVIVRAGACCSLDETRAFAP